MIRPRVMLVDDDAAVRSAVSGALAGEGDRDRSVRAALP